MTSNSEETDTVNNRSLIFDGAEWVEYEPRELLRSREVLAAIRQLHRTYGIYDECDHHHTEEDIETGRVVDTGEFLACEETKMYDICWECCLDDEQTEACAYGHDHGPDKPICPTIAILDGAP